MAHHPTANASDWLVSWRCLWLSLLLWPVFAQAQDLPGSGDGLLGTYYDQNAIPFNFFTGTQVERVDPVLDFSVGSGQMHPSVPSNHFSVIWTGELELPRTTRYRLGTRSDDGIRVFVDFNRDGDFNDANERLIDNFTLHAARFDWSFTFRIDAGRYPIRVEYFEAGGDAVMELYWRSSFFSTQIIPQRHLYSNRSSSYANQPTEVS